MSRKKNFKNLNDKMVKGITKSGFRFSINTDIFRDMEFLELLAKVDKEDFSIIPDFLTKFLGDRQKKNLYEFCRDDKGIVDAFKVSDVLREIMESNDLKNSLSLPR
ncbi:MAG: hypothetical protein Q4B36_05160 [Tissierellia bacterium]|nr:hypothetical protein [Tissierellia bacterium]